MKTSWKLLFAYLYVLQRTVASHVFQNRQRISPLNKMAFVSLRTKPSDLQRSPKKLHDSFRYAGTLKKSSFSSITCMSMNEDNDGNSEWIPKGRVKSIPKHMERLDRSLQSLSGKGLFERIDEIRAQSQTKEEQTLQSPITVDEIDSSTRFNVLSHGNQSDPIYDYGNSAALATFGYTEEEFVALPSKYSASEIKGFRQEREEFLEELRQYGYGTLRNAVRVNKEGEMVKIENVLLWNVYDEESGVRTGQAALFDNEVVEPYNPDADVDSNSDEARIQSVELG